MDQKTKKEQVKANIDKIRQNLLWTRRFCCVSTRNQGGFKMVITTASDLVFKTITSGTYGKIIFEAILKTIFKKKVTKKVLNKKKKNL